MNRPLITAALLALAGCAPRLYVNVLQPAPVNLGAVKKLAVYETQGRRSAREVITQELVNQARAAGYFTVVDRSEDGTTVKVAGRTVQVAPGKGQPQAADEVGLRIDILDWNADRDTQTSKDSKGNVITKQIWVGRVLLQVTAFNAAGKAYVAEKEYKAKWNDERDEDAAITAAGRVAVRNLLDEITPHYVRKAIRLDDDEEPQKRIVEMARNGEVPKAIDEERALIAQAPNSAAAVYNLAVLLDSQGLYRDALPLYEQAIRLSAKDYYVEMKEECSRRLADAEALAN